MTPETSNLEIKNALFHSGGTVAGATSEAPFIYPFSFHRFLERRQMPQLSFTSSYTGCFEYLGSVQDSTLAHRAALFCRDTAGVVGDVQTALQAFIDEALAHHIRVSQTALWFCLRVSQPDTIFDYANWHHDGCYFTPLPGERAFKIGGSLIGPQTLFLNSVEKEQQQWERPYRLGDVEYSSRTLSAVVTETESIGELFAIDSESPEPMEDQIAREHAKWAIARELIEEGVYQVRCLSPELGQFAKWTVGDKIHGSVHSEPALTTPRLYVSILPGTVEQIRELCGKWDSTLGEDSIRSGEIRTEFQRTSLLNGTFRLRIPPPLSSDNMLPMTYIPPPFDRYNVKYFTASTRYLIAQETAASESCIAAEASSKE